MRALLLLTAILISGCMESQRSVRSSGSGPAPSTKDLKDRAESLQKLHGWGVVELRWVDDSGSHFEQGDLEFWIDGPDHLAVRISKLGDTYLWLGMNDQKAWVFDLSQKPTRLLVDSLGRLQKAGLEEGSWLAILEMIQLMKIGLGAVPPPPTEDLLSSEMMDDSIATYIWRLDRSKSTSKSSRLQMKVNTSTWQPLVVEIRDSDGTGGLVLKSPSRKTKRIEIPDRSSLAWPVISRVLEVQDLDDPGTIAKFAFEGITASLDGEPIERIFDVNILRDAFKPEVQGSILEMSSEDSNSSRP